MEHPRSLPHRLCKYDKSIVWPCLAPTCLINNFLGASFGLTSGVRLWPVLAKNKIRDRVPIHRRRRLEHETLPCLMHARLFSDVKAHVNVFSLCTLYIVASIIPCLMPLNSYPLTPCPTASDRPALLEEADPGESAD